MVVLIQGFLIQGVLITGWLIGQIYRPYDLGALDTPGEIAAIPYHLL
jgi:hypothetical protein